MDTNNLNDAPRRGSCSSQAQRPNADLARRLVALLCTQEAHAQAEMVRALALLTAPGVVRDVGWPDEAITRDGRYALLTVRFVREGHDGWTLDVVAQVQVDAYDDTQDHEDVHAVALRNGLHTIALDTRCELTPGERHHLGSSVESARAFVRQQIHDDRISACSEVR